MRDLDDRDARPPFTLLSATTWVLGTFLLFVFSIGIVGALAPDAIEDGVSAAAVNAAVFVFVTALLVGRYPPGETLASTVGLRRVSALRLGLALVVGVTAQVPAEALFRLVKRFFPVSAAEEARMVEILTGTSIAHSVMLFVFLAIAVPIAEELFFRGAIFGALRRDGTSSRTVWLYTSVTFTLFHPEPKIWPPVLLLAVVLGAFRTVSGSLLPPIAVHIGFNAVTMASSLTSVGPHLEAWLAPAPHQWAVSAVCGAAIAGFVALSTNAASRERRAEDERGR